MRAAHVQGHHELNAFSNARKTFGIAEQQLPVAVT